MYSAVGVFLLSSSNQESANLIGVQSCNSSREDSRQCFSLCLYVSFSSSDIYNDQISGEKLKKFNLYSGLMWLNLKFLLVL